MLKAQAQVSPPPRPPRMALLRAEELPTDPTGWRRAEISSFAPSYLSQAGTVGLGRPGLEQGRGELFYISHSVRGDSGFWSLSAGRWSIDESLARCVWLKMFEVELK